MQERAEVWVLGFETVGVGGQEAHEGEEGLPEKGPVVWEAGAGCGEVG